MRENDLPIMIYTTFSSEEDAERVGGELVAQKLAACVNIFGGMKSIYGWEGELKNDHEVAMLIKSRMAVKSQLIELLNALHPYDTPVAFVISGEALGAGYCQWLVDQTSAPDKDRAK